MAHIISGQDWDTVTLTKRPQHVGGASKDADAHAPSKSNKGAALDHATEAMALPKADRTVAQRIMQARLAKKMTQAKLASAVNVRANVIQALESGAQAPDSALVSKLNRALGVSLRGQKKAKAPAKAPAAKAAAKKPSRL